ncbi:MAG: aminopeptidase [Caldilineaceae bacterium]
MPSLQSIAQRLVEGIQAQPGEVIQIADRTGRTDLLYELFLTLELAGATPILDIEPPTFTRWLLTEATADELVRFGRHRVTSMQRADREITLSGGVIDLAGVNPTRLAPWRAIDEEVTAIEEGRQLPILSVAIPTAAQAAHLGMTLAELEEHLLPALAVSAAENQRLIDQTLAQVLGGQQIAIRSGQACVLTMQQGDRTWLTDDGVIDEADRSRGAIVSNLPAGSIYTTVLEGETEGSLYVPRFHQATEVVLHFAQGRIVSIDAATGADELVAWLDSHSGEPRRISHIGMGLNPALSKPVGWTLVDEHILGALFVALGENRYMGGENAASLNYDLALLNATLEVAGRVIR